MLYLFLQFIREHITQMWMCLHQASDIGKVF